MFNLDKWGRGKRNVEPARKRAMSIERRQKQRAEELRRLRACKPNPKPEPEVKVADRPIRAKGPRFDSFFENVFEAFKPRNPPPPPKSAFESGKAFIFFLEKRGFKVLGKGAYSTVLAKEGSAKVLKVGRTPDAWIDYINWAHKKGYGGTFAPRVYSYKYFQSTTKNPFYVAVMERLSGVASALDRSHDHALSYELFYAGCRGYKMATTLIDLVQQGLGKFTLDFRERFYTSHHSLDLHGGNFMLRSDQQFVLTDPLCGRGKLTTNRFRYKDLSPANDNQLEVKCAA